MNNESFDDLLNRLNNQEKQQVIEYAYMYDDLRYLREHGRYLQKQLEAYENMKKEANKWVEDNVYLDYYGMPVIPNNSKVNELIDILNKVGEDNE